MYQLKLTKDEFLSKMTKLNAEGLEYNDYKEEVEKIIGNKIEHQSFITDDETYSSPNMLVVYLKDGIYKINYSIFVEHEDIENHSFDLSSMKEMNENDVKLLDELYELMQQRSVAYQTVVYQYNKFK